MKGNADLKRDNCITFCLGGILGAIAFIAIYGIAYVNPTNDSWLINIGSDLSIEYVGLQFYRTSSWRFPLALIENVIYPEALSTMFTDLPPILAVLIKILSPILPETFQPFGLLILFAYIFQGGLSAVIIYLRTNKVVNSVIGSLFFTLSTTVIGRVYAQNILAVHVIILFALYIFERREELYHNSTKKHLIYWSIAMAIAASTHMYYVPMVFCFMFYFYLFFAVRENDIKNAFLFVIPTLSALMSMWVFGVLYGAHTYNAESFGDMNLRLNGFFITGNTSFIQHLFGIKSSFRSDYEGYAYIGAGAIFLICITGFYIIKDKRYKSLDYRKMIPILAVILTFVLVSINPSLKIGDYVIAELHYPQVMNDLFSIFRANGRFVWPVIYILLYGLIVFISDYVDEKKGIAIIIVCLIFQIFDLSEYIVHKREYVDYLSKIPAVIQDEYWESIADHDEIFFFVNGDEIIHKSYSVKTIIALSEYGFKNDMRLNDCYCSRKNAEWINEERKKEIKQIRSGNPDPSKIYVFPNFDEEISKLDCFILREVDGIWIGIAK